MATIAASQMTEVTGNSAAAYAELGESYFSALIGVELALVMLVAPAATAGAICLDRARGTLAHMLMTDLSDTEIVVGKLGARLLPVLGLVACSWPVMAISTLLGGIDPIALAMAFAIMVAVAVFGCALALALSVWARKAHEVILATYTVFIAGILLWPIWTGLSLAGAIGPPQPWALLANPFYVAFAPYAVPGKLGGWDYCGFFAAVLGSALALTVVAVWRTRAVASRGSVEQGRGLRLGLVGRLMRRLPGPSLDRNPVLWREWRRSRPSPWMIGILTLLLGTTAVLCIVGAIAIRRDGVGMNVGGNAWSMAGICSYFLHVIFGLLLVSAVAPTSMSEERQRGSLDVLAATALSTRAIVLGKWLATFRLTMILTLAPGLFALAMATARSNGSFPPTPTGGPGYDQPVSRGARIYGVVVVVAAIAAHGALFTSIGLALAVWIKRQSRAIAVSVALVILITAAWPFFVSIIANGAGIRSQGLTAVSPVSTMVYSVSYLMLRRNMLNDHFLWWGAFWAVEVSALALALLWLTIRTFDRCLDRVSDRARQIPIRSVAVLILALLLGAGSLCRAIDAWIEGVRPHTLESLTALEILLYALTIAIGLVLVATVAMTSISASRQRDFVLEDDASGLQNGGIVVSRWWTAFRLVLLLAIGPGILALALATAHKPIRLVAKTTTLPSGGQTMTWEPADPAEANVEIIGEVRRGTRVWSAAALLMSILAHGGAAVSIGLALAAKIKRPTRFLSAGVGLAVVLIIAIPLYLAWFLSISAEAAGMWNFVTAANSLLIALFTRFSHGTEQIIRSVLCWDGIVAVCAVYLLWWTARAWQRRPRSANQVNPRVTTLAFSDAGSAGPLPRKLDDSSRTSTERLP
jgi:ABC-type transport system involved in multi-copper enzyme maturation permease subunit